MKKTILLTALAGFLAGAAATVVAQQAGVNILRFHDRPPTVEFLVFDKGEYRERGRIVFPSRQHAVRTGESIIDRFATKKEKEYFCTWALHEETE